MIAILGWLIAPQHLGAQQTQQTQQDQPDRTVKVDYLHTQWFPSLWGPYTSPAVPAPRMSNSQLIHSLISDGKLHLNVQDAIALALENNLDIAVARYNVAFAQTDLARTLSGGAARGIQGATISSALFAGALGGGVAASGGGGGGRAGGFIGGGGATNTGPQSSFDPFFGMFVGQDSSRQPLSTAVLTGSPIIDSRTTQVIGFMGQRFQTGTSYSINLGGARSSTTSQGYLFNPQVTNGFTFGINQPLLKGFGRRANSQFIRIAKNDVKVADSVFRNQIITTVSQILNYYWDFLAFQENVRVAQQALAYAQKLLSDNKRQVEIGTLAPIEVVRAESEVAAREQDLIVAQTSLQQQQELIKTALSKQVDQELMSAQITPEDKLPEPQPDDVPSLDEALKQAFANRPEIQQAELNLRNQGIAIQSARNALLPEFDLFATYIGSALSGNRLIYQANPSNPFGFGQVVGSTPGGITQTFTQLFHATYPDYSVGFQFIVPIRNRQAQADAATALLQERQQQMQLQKTKNDIAQAVRSAEIGVVQAKAQIEAARKAVTLAQQTLDAEQKKFQLGESTVFLVIQAQRDLATAEGNEVKARSTYAKALTQYQQVTASILDRYRIEMNDALQGKVNRVPNIPGTPAQQPGTPQQPQS
jgi:outer membrane protein